MEASSVCVAVVWGAGAAAAALPDPGAPGIFSVVFVGEDNSDDLGSWNGHQHARFWEENSPDRRLFSDWGTVL